MNKAYVLSPLGWLEMVSDGKKLIGLRFKKTGKTTKITCPVLKETETQLKEYFQGKRKEFRLPLEFKGTPFQMSVWNALQEVPFGKTLSYATLAKKVGNPNAFRAVGTALGRNRIPIVLPCHRIVKSDAGLGGFTGGLHIKKKLLDLENAF